MCAVHKTAHIFCGYLFSVGADTLQDILGNRGTGDTAEGHSCAVSAADPSDLTGGIQAGHHGAVLIQDLGALVSGDAALSHVIGGLNLGTIVGALSVEGTGALGQVGIVVSNSGLQALGVNAQLLSQLVQGLALLIIAGGHVLAGTVVILVQGTVSQIEGSAVG